MSTRDLELLLSAFLGAAFEIVSMAILRKPTAAHPVFWNFESHGPTKVSASALAWKHSTDKKKKSKKRDWKRDCSHYYAHHWTLEIFTARLGSCSRKPHLKARMHAMTDINWEYRQIVVVVIIIVSFICHYQRLVQTSTAGRTSLLLPQEAKHRRCLFS